MPYSPKTQAQRDGARVMHIALESVAAHFAHRGSCLRCISILHCQEGDRLSSLARHHTGLALETVGKLEAEGRAKKKTTKGDDAPC